MRRRLGRGGMGTVYLADAPDGRPVAVKVINPELAADPDFRERFRREVEAARRVRRFCTAPVLDASLATNPLYVVTEYIAGPTLTEAVAGSGPLRGSDLEGVAVGMATALSAIHSAGLIHRDLKPANVLLSSTGPRVIDFGIARALDATTGVTRTGQLVGTPAYMAPELVTGQPITPAADVWAWACVVVFAGTGRSPFEAPHLMAVLHNVAYAAPELSGFVDPGLRGLVEAALSKNPADRPTVPQILDHLAGHVSTHPGPPHPTAPAPLPPPVASPGTNRAALAIAGGAVAVLVAVAATVLIMRDTGDGKPQDVASGPASARQNPASSAGPSSGSRPPPVAPPSSAASSGSGDADGAPSLVGVWTGKVTQPGIAKSPYDVKIVYTGGFVQEVVGTSEYPTLGCKGDLKAIYITEDKRKVTVQERINSGPCENNVFVELSLRPDAKTLYYSFQTGSTHGDGILDQTP
ncbi:serine/threonine-protein kinase [Actinocorallia lasiicapitis]